MRLLLRLPRLPTRSTPLPYTTLFRSQPLAQRTGGGLHAGRVGKLGMTRRGRMQLAKILQLFHRQIVARSEDTRLNSSHVAISYAVLCLKKKMKQYLKNFAPKA